MGWMHFIFPIPQQTIEPLSFLTRSQVALGNENDCQAKLGRNRERSQAQLGNEKNLSNYQNFQGI
jgi:hypothetical protein